MFLYYVPVGHDELKNGELLNHARLPAPLSAVLSDCKMLASEVVLNPVRGGTGPGETSGTVIAPLSKDTAPKDMTYRPQTQQWHPSDDGDYWIGVNNDQLPMPELLRRNRMTPGCIVVDEGGRSWQVPIARAPDEPLGWLPQFYEFNASGKVVPQVLESQSAIWELGQEVWDWYNRDILAEGIQTDSTLTDADANEAKKTPRPDFNWLIETALKVLAWNYRVGPLELKMLRMFCGGPVLTQATVFGITQTLIGFDLLAENSSSQKKTVATSQA